MTGKSLTTTFVILSLTLSALAAGHSARHGRYLVVDPLSHRAYVLEVGQAPSCVLAPVAEIPAECSPCCGADSPARTARSCASSAGCCLAFPLGQLVMASASPIAVPAPAPRAGLVAAADHAAVAREFKPPVPPPRFG